MGLVRFLPALFLFLGTFVNYFTRVSINIAIISMTDGAQSLCNETSSSASVVSNVTGHTVFCWSEHDKSNVKGAFYIGYIFLQVPGGRMAEIFGTRRVLGTATMVSGLLMILSPFASVINVWFLIIMRVLIGLAQGVLFPSINPMLIRWCRQQDYSKFAALASMGGTFGTVIIYPLCGFILLNYNWKAVFYISGLVSLLWCFFWFLLITDDPSQCKLLPRRDKELILNDRSPPVMNGHRWVPYKKILTTPSVLTLMLCSFANDWGLYMLLTEGPNFLNNIMDVNIATIGFVSSIPYLGRFCGAQLSGLVADYLLFQPWLISKLNVRRLMFSIAFLSPATALAMLGYLTQNWHAVIAVMSIGFSLNGFNVPAFLNIVDIAPDYSGTVTGFTNGFSSMTGFIVPTIAAAFTSVDPKSPENWKIVFFSGTFMYLFALGVFMVLGTVIPADFNNSDTDYHLEESMLDAEETEQMIPHESPIRKIKL